MGRIDARCYGTPGGYGNMLVFTLTHYLYEMLIHIPPQ